jgi:hypothetical protein
LTGSLRRNPSELFAAAVDISIALLHEPPVAYHHRLAGQSVAPRAGEKQDRVGDIVSGGEFAVHRVLQHDAPDDFILADAKRFGLLGYLFVSAPGEAGAVQPVKDRWG